MPSRTERGRSQRRDGVAARTRADVDDWQNSLPDFQGASNLSLFADGASVASFSTTPAPRFEYGAVLWPLYLDEIHGDGQGTLIRQIWQGTAEADDATDALIPTLPAINWKENHVVYFGPVAKAGGGP